MIPTLVLLAAGMSTRYGRLKQLEPVGPCGEALLDYAVFDARRAGFSRILLIIREELEETFRSHIQGSWPEDLEVVFHFQRVTDLPGVELGAAPDSEALDSGSATVASILRGRTKPWGTGHALLTARAHLPHPFVLLNADDFYGAEAFHQATELLQSGMFSQSGEKSVGEATSTFGLVTYTLAETLSDHGGVSRGICEVDGKGWLVGVQEVLEILKAGPGLAGRTVVGRDMTLSGREAISTNFWIFTPAVFTLLEESFADFFGAQVEAAIECAAEATIEGAAEATNEDALEEAQGSAIQPEFLIPTVVNGALDAGVARVRAVPTRGRFLGITHPQDRSWVVGGLKEMTREGRYPSPLWDEGDGKE